MTSVVTIRPKTCTGCGRGADRWSDAVVARRHTRRRRSTRP